VALAGHDLLPRMLVPGLILISILS